MLVIPPGVSPQRCRASPAPAWRRAPRSAPHAHDGVDGELAEGRAKFDREPQDFESQLGAYLGNGFSVAPLLRQSAYLRPHNRDPRIPGLYIAGAGTHPGAGVPGVINSAKATARVILEDFKV